MDQRIAWAVAEMQKEMREPLSIARLARTVHLSPSRFAHLFRREVGVPPGRYLHTLRMARAQLLLERTFLSVKEVMALVGCNDPSHFARDFRRAYGMSPVEARASATMHRRPPDPRARAPGEAGAEIWRSRFGQQTTGFANDIADARGGRLSIVNVRPLMNVG
jgi:AraC-like DNA-binding protein